MAERGLRVEIHHTAAAFISQKAPKSVQGMGLTARPRQTQSKGSRNTLQELSKKQQHTLWLSQINVTKVFFCNFSPQELIFPDSPGSVLFAAPEQCAEP